MKHSQNAIDLIKEFEGCEMHAYQDQRGIWTLGFGHTIGVKESDSCTLEQAEKWLSADIGWVDSVLARLVKRNLTQNQYDALVSLIFNIGSGNFSSSTLLQLLEEHDDLGAANQFLQWTRAGGIISKGLVRRRNKERELFIKESTADANQ